MTTDGQFEIFLVATPGHETALYGETRERNFGKAKIVPGGVTIRGGWREVWRANLQLRGTGRVLARIGDFPVEHLAELDKRARGIDWGRILRPDLAFAVDVTCKRSRIYHSGAAAERIERAITAKLAARHDPDAGVVIKARIENDVCTLAVDTSGEPLHKRGHKAAVIKAPMRETLAAMFLRQCGYAGCEPVLDPMCGSGTFVIEAAEIAAGLHPGRSRRFAFEQLKTFDAAAWEKMRAAPARTASSDPTALRFHGSDRDPGAIRMSRANAERAGVTGVTQFDEREIDELVAPAGPPGLVIVNPPYGARIGEASDLKPLYRRLGTALLARFQGWRVGLITSEPRLAQATGLPFMPPIAPVLHGGMRITLYRTEALQ